MSSPLIIWDIPAEPAVSAPASGDRLAALEPHRIALLFPRLDGDEMTS
jgi:hypothetical protein